MAVTNRCTAGCDGNGNRCDFDDAMNQRPKNLSTPTVNCCMACCYTTGVTSAAAATKKYCKKIGKTYPANNFSSSAYVDYDEPPSEATAFIASASAAAFILLVALLAVILSSVVVLCLASLAPTVVAAADVPGPGPRASDYLHRWHNQRDVEQQQQQQSYLWHLQQQQQLSRLDRGDSEDAVRPKRQLLKKNNREPGIVALTFSLIGGTVSDAREAYRNVTNIVRDTLSEAARAQQSTTSTAIPTGGDQMMMGTGNSNENEIVASSTAVAPSVDQQMAGQAFSKLFGRNFRGLRRLFDSELRTALKNSPGNVRDFTAELIGSIGQSLRPSRLFTRGPTNSDSSTTSNRR